MNNFERLMEKIKDHYGEEIIIGDEIVDKTDSEVWDKKDVFIVTKVSGQNISAKNKITGKNTNFKVTKTTNITVIGGVKGSI